MTSCAKGKIVFASFFSPFVCDVFLKVFAMKSNNPRIWNHYSQFNHLSFSNILHKVNNNEQSLSTQLSLSLFSHSVNLFSTQKINQINKIEKEKPIEFTILLVCSGFSYAMHYRMSMSNVILLWKIDNHIYTQNKLNQCTMRWIHI